jgi:putative salt-induced outer membrane protein
MPKFVSLPAVDSRMKTISDHIDFRSFRPKAAIFAVFASVMAMVCPIAWGDQLTLKNGEKLLGTVVSKGGDKLTFKSQSLGEVGVPWASIESLSTEAPLAVTLPGGKAVVGKITVDNQNVQIATPSGDERAALADVGSIGPPDFTQPGLLDLWNGFFDIGFAAARGNARTNILTTSMKATRTTKTDEVKVYFNQIYSTARINGIVADSASAIRGGWMYNKGITSRLFVNLLNDYEYDRFQNLDLRFVAGGGLGYSLVKTETSRLDVLGGGTYNHEKFSTPLTRNSGEIYWGNDYLYKGSRLTTFQQSFRMFNNLSRTGEYRINFDIGMVTTIKRWLGWQITASDRYLSNPVPGRQKNDILISTGLRLSFARH